MSDSGRVIVVQMHGEPGSGKSTLARALAPRIGALVLDKDIIKSALLRSGATDALAARAAYEAYFDLARSLVAQGYALILDNPVYWPRVEEQWLAVSKDAGSPPLLVECVCSDRDDLVRRLATRSGLESNPRDPLDLKKHPGATPTAYEPRITLDTTRPLDDLLVEAVAFIQARLAVDAIGAAR